MGNLDFVERVKSELGHKPHCELISRLSTGWTGIQNRKSKIQNPSRVNFSGENEALSSENARFWDENY